MIAARASVTVTGKAVEDMAQKAAVIFDELLGATAWDFVSISYSPYIRESGGSVSYWQADCEAEEILAP
jgi:hypothetical protein